MRENMGQNSLELPGFGEGEYLSASEYEPGKKITVKVVEFLGGEEFETTKGEKKVAPFYRVESGGKHKKFRLGTANAQILKQQYKIKSYESLIGKTIVLKVKKYGVGNGFEVDDCA